MIIHKKCNGEDNPNNTDEQLKDILKNLAVSYAKFTIDFCKLCLLKTYNTEDEVNADIDMLIRSNPAERLDVYNRLKEIGAIGVNNPMFITIDESFEIVRKAVVNMINKTNRRNK